MTLTTEQLRARAAAIRCEALSKADQGFAFQSQRLYETAAALDELAANREAQPVERVTADNMQAICMEANRHLGKYSVMAKEVNKLLNRRPLTAPPAPAVPDEATAENVEALSGYVSTYKMTESERNIAAEVWNACRAAMLAATPEGGNG